MDRLFYHLTAHAKYVAEASRFFLNFYCELYNKSFRTLFKNYYYTQHNNNNKNRLN